MSLTKNLEDALNSNIRYKFISQYENVYSEPKKGSRESLKAFHYRQKLYRERRAYFYDKVGDYIKTSVTYGSEGMIITIKCFNSRSKFYKDFKQFIIRNELLDD